VDAAKRVRRAWLAWRRKAVGALSALGADERLPPELRAQLCEVARSAQTKRTVVKKLIAMARASALAARACVHGADPSLALAVIPGGEIDELARDRAGAPRVSFNAWRAKVVAALARAAIAAEDAEVRAALADAAEEIAELRKPKRVKSWSSGGAKRLRALAALLKLLADETGSAELASLVPSETAIAEWLGGGLPPLRRAPAEKQQLTPNALRAWLERRLAAEKGAVAYVPLSEIAAAFKLRLGAVEKCARALESLNVGGWVYRGYVYVNAGARPKRVRFVFARVK